MAYNGFEAALMMRRQIKTNQEAAKMTDNAPTFTVHDHGRILGDEAGDPRTFTTLDEATTYALELLNGLEAGYEPTLLEIHDSRDRYGRNIRAVAKLTEGDRRLLDQATNPEPDDGEEEDLECEGHPCEDAADDHPHAAIGEVFYCDGSCRA